MKFCETNLKGCFLIEIDKKYDERGFFVRTWDKEEFCKNENFTILNFLQGQKQILFQNRGVLYSIM